MPQERSLLRMNFCGAIPKIISLLSLMVRYQVKGNNILAHWSLNGTEQGLTLHGGPTFVEGRYPGSKAINFNQTSDCFARIPKVELRGISFTIAMWIKIQSIVNRRQQFFCDWKNPFQFYMGILQSGSFIFSRHSSAKPWFSLATTKVIEVSKWTHVAVTWNQGAGVVKLFVDAKENRSRAFNKAIVWNPPTKDTYLIGDARSSYNNHQFLGSVMELYIIEGVLSSEQLKYLKLGLMEITCPINNTVVYTNETVTCQAIGSPTPYVAWVRSGKVLVNKTSLAKITITENNGEYVCIASNQHGNKKLIVNAKAPLQLCHDHLLITDVSRAVNHIFQSSQVKSDVTDIDLSKWYRIQSPADNQLATTCVPQNRCGTQAPGWLNGPHPSIQDGVVKRTVCFHFNGDCCYQNSTVHIRKCLGFYVYKFNAVPNQLPAPRHCIDNQRIDTQDQLDSMFQEAQDGPGHNLAGYGIYTEEETLTHYACMDYCLLVNGCKSFNYSKDLKICELNNATRREHPEAFAKKHSFLYYEKISVQPVNVI